MKNRSVEIAWGILAAFCLVLGFVPSRDGLFYFLRMLLAIGFFIPPGIFLYRKAHVRLIFVLSACSLGVTAVLLVLNILAVGATAAAGNMVYYMLVFFSVPMFCGEVWVVSLFLWACLLMVSLQMLRKKA